MENPEPIIKFDLSKIPEYRVTALVENLAEYVLEYLEQPGVREKYDEWLRKRAATKGGDTKERG